MTKLPSPVNFTDILKQRAFHQPHRLAYVFLTDGETTEIRLTYKELDEYARVIASQLQSLAIKDNRALLLYPPGIEYITAFFGCLYAGITAVPIYPPRLNKPDPRLQAVIADAQIGVALTTTQILSKLKRRSDHIPELANLDLLATDQNNSFGADDYQNMIITPKTLAFLQYTSGSTAAPKGVMVSHGNLLHNSALIQQAFAHTQDSVGVIWLPPYHDMGLIGGILQPVFSGFPVILMSPIAFLQRPIRWLQAISRYQATTSGGPNFAYDFCVRKTTPEERAHLDLSRWQVAFNGAEPIRPDTLEEFTTAFAPYGFRREAFYPCYGLAEATLIASGGLKSAPPILHRVERQALEKGEVVPVTSLQQEVSTLVGCGQVLADQKIIIVDPKSLTQCLPGQVGEIWLAGNSITQGYWHRPEETAHTFQAYLADTGKGPFLRTGDLGFLHGDDLFVTGRLKDLIIIRGLNYYPQDIEYTVEQSHLALQPGSGAAFSIPIDGVEQLVVVQELKRTHRKANTDEVAKSVRQAITHVHHLQTYAVVLLKPMSIPKTSSNKIRRHACREGFLTGTLQVTGSSVLSTKPSKPVPVGTTEEKSFIYKVLTTVTALTEKRRLVELYLQEEVGRVLQLSPSQIDVKQPLSVLGFDSLTAVELTHKIETNLHTALSITDILQGATVSQLAAYILNQETAVSPDHQIQAVISSPQNPLALSSAQRRLWLAHQLAPNVPLLNIPITLHLSGPLNKTAVASSLTTILHRHEALRTVFQPVNQDVAQVILPPHPLELRTIDLRMLSPEKREERASQLVHKAAQQLFDLTRGPLLQAALFQLAEEEHILSLVMHHIISDGWSINIFLRELALLYRTFCDNQPVSLPELPIQYKDFTRWQQEQLSTPLLTPKLTYWQEKLTGIPPSLALPHDHLRPSVNSWRGATCSAALAQDLTAAMKTFCRQHGVTPFMVLLTALKILLFKWTQQKDIVIGTVSANRTRPETEALIGCFINFLAIRSQITDEQTGLALLKQIKTTVLEAFAHQDCPFEEVVKVTNPERLSNQNPLYNVALLMQNITWQTGLNHTVEARLVPIHTQTSLLDLRFIVYESTEGMTLVCEYNVDLFEAQTVESLLHAYHQTIAYFTRHPEIAVTHYPLPKTLESQAQLAQNRQQEEAYTTTIAATFTAEPVAESLSFWLEKLNFSSNIQFAPYNQVFQQLLDPASLLNTNEQGLNIILWRFEDWLYQDEGNLLLQLSADEKEQSLHDQKYPLTSKMKNEIERNANDFIQALKSAAAYASVPYLLCICPPTPHRYTTFYEQVGELLSHELDKVNNIHLITTPELATYYPVKTYYEPDGDKLGHIPYTPVFFAALGSMLARRAHAIQTPPHKVIVLDCDQTLWQGICGEDDVSNITIDQPRQFLQRFMIDQQKAGRLLCLCSKNSEKDVFNVFDNHPDMLLKRKHLVDWRINWLPKSENLKSLAHSLQLGLDSFIFIDDNPIECAEVRANCPEVLTIQLPIETKNIPRFLHHVWAFDSLKVTDEDSQRTTLYKQEAKRQQFLEEMSTFESFLAGLNLVVEIKEMTTDQLPRVSQLTQRTNQFNMTTIRRTPGELEQLCVDDQLACFVVTVRDRFGDYGLVGAMVLAINSDNIFVDTFLLSCRALGRQVEHQMLARLGQVAQEHNLHKVTIPYRPTEKNQPALNFLETVGGSFKQVTDKGLIFEFPADFAAALRDIDSVEV